MKNERLFQILGLIDDDLIEEAETVSSPTISKRHPCWRSALTAAACMAVVALGCFTWLTSGGLQKKSSSIAESTTTETVAPEEVGTVVQDTEPLSADGLTFMSYAGPIFPLTTLEEIGGFTVERNTVWDFTPDSMSDGSPRQWGATVSDSYLLMNHTSGEILAMACYPIAASYDSLSDLLPVVSVDGSETDWELYAGAYAGSFRDAGVEDGSTWNPVPPDSWTDYQVLLEDGTYLAEALESPAPLTQEVVVYEFTDFTAPEDYDAATQAIEFTIDDTQTQILSYGFNGMSWDTKSGWRQYDYFVPRAIQQEETSKLLILLGEDLQDYTLQGYINGACEAGEELAGVSCTVTRRETTLDSILTQLCQAEINAYLADLRPGDSNRYDLISLEQCRAAVTDLLTRYGPLAEDGGTDRYSDGRLDDLLHEALHQSRVAYLVFPMTIPAEGSAEVTVSFRKEPSFDYGVSGSRQGYDLVTTLGSTLDFTQQTAALTNTEQIELTHQNFGFNLERGITEVPLDPATEHYFLTVHPKS